MAVHWKGTLGSNGIRAERPWYAEVHAVIDELDNVEGVPPLLSLFDTDSSDIEVYLLASGEIDARLANAPEEQRAWLMQDCGIDAAADAPLIFIKYDLSINEVRACIVSMMTKGLGFTDTEDVAELPGSNLDMTPSYPYLTNLDKVLVQVLYDSRYAPTMSRQEGMAAAARIVADLVP